MARVFGAGGYGFCAVVALQIVSTLPVAAQGYCDVASEPGLSLGCARTLVDTSILGGAYNPANRLINPIIGSHDGLVFDSDWIASSGEKRLRFDGNVRFTRPIQDSWENVYFGSTRGDGQRTAFDVIALKRGSNVTDRRSVELQFGRLTIENTALTFKDAMSADGRQSGNIRYLLIGDGARGRGGVLTLRNSSLEFVDATELYVAAPGNIVPVIRAESGDNLLKIGDQSKNLNRLSVVVDDGANLTFDGTAITPRTEGNLTVGFGANLTVEKNSIVGLLSNVGSSLPQTTVDGGAVTVDGELSELRLTAPVFNDSTISLESGSTLRVQQRNGVRSTLSFSGNSSLNFGSSQAAVLGTTANPQAVLLQIGTGTTEITSAGAMTDAGRGLQVDQIRIDGGTLDTSGYSAGADQANAWLDLRVQNGGTFYDQLEFYNNLDRLIVDSGTLQTRSSFGDFGVADGIDVARFTNSTIDLTSASSLGAGGGSLSTGLQSVTLNAKNLEFAGANQVVVGVKPSGECVSFGGACVPSTTNYAGELVANVGGSPTSKLTGFDTILFVPKAIDASAVSADYVSGGKNGIYTVARVDYNGDLTNNVQGFDAAPKTPTVSDLAAAGSDLPANLTYAIINDPVNDDRVDISFVDLTLQNHPQLTPNYTPQTVNKVIVEPTTGNISTITVVIQPDANGATQTTTTVVTEPNGNIISTLTDTAKLDPAKGTTNTQNYGQLVTQTGGSLSHSGLQQVGTLHPEAYASYMTVALEHSDHLRNMVLGNSRGQASGGGRVEGFTESGRRLWLDTALMRGDVDSNGGLAGFSYDLGEIVLGGDLWSNETTNIGAYVGYGQYSMNEHTSSTSSLDFSSKAYHIGAYGAYDSSSWSMTGMAGFSWANTDTTREAVTGSTSNIHNADYDSRTFEAAVRAEYMGFTSGGSWQMVPEIGLGYARYNQDAITETGASGTALTIKDATAESLIGSIGLNMTGPEFGGGLEPLAFVRYEHDFLASRDDVHEIDAAFATSPGTSQTFLGTHRGPSAVSIGFGLSSAAGSSADVSAGLVYTKNTYGDEFGGGLRITWAF